MSIYPVRLAEWFPKKAKKTKYSSVKDNKRYHENMKMMVKYSECIHCGRKKIDWRTAYGHHSLPWGYGDVWCTKRCYEGKKK